MKYMKLGSKPDNFYTDEAVRSVPSDVPTDLIVHIGHTTFLLHKFPLLVKCGLVQRLCSDGRGENDSGEARPIALHDIPGGEEAFELCAKFCYGITINLSAHNFAAAISGAKFLRMNESVAKGNFIGKLELFFDSCILDGWKDSILTLQSMWKLSGWSDDHRIVQPCMDSIIGKILVHPSEVSWSYTYTRIGYNKKKQKHAVPKDWWTEDVSDLELELFRSIISTVKSTKKLPAALVGEALHVYSCKHLPSSPELQKKEQSNEAMSKHRQLLEAIVSMIPAEPRSVSGSFLLRLLDIAGHVRASSSTRAELVRRSGQQLDEVAAGDLLISDVGMVEAVLESFLLQLCQSAPREETERVVAAMAKVGRTFDSYLQIIAGDSALPVSKFIELAGSLPEMARTEHDGLYQAIDTYLTEHPELNKAEKKRLCRMIDCRKLSAEARVDAIANDQLPLRTIVQLLFIDQETNAGAGAGAGVAQQVSVAKAAAAAAAQDEEKNKSRNRAESRQHHHRDSALATRAEKTRVVPSPATEPTRTSRHLQT